MTALPSVANVFRARILFSIGDKPDQGVRVFFRWSGSAPSAAAATTLAGDLFSTASLNLPAAMHPDNSITGVILEDLTSPTGAVGEASGTTPGTETGGPLGADTAFVASYEIPVRYRGGHPRSYWPLGTDTDVDTPQSWLGSSVTAFEAAVSGTIFGFTGVSAEGCNVGVQVAISYYEGFMAVENPLTHRYRNVPQLRVTPEVYDVASITGRSYIGSQRRRRLKTS